MMDKKGIYALLDKACIAYESYDHPGVYTMEELFNQSIPHRERIVKSLFLRDDKKRNYYLVTLAGHKTVDLKGLSERIPSRKLSFSSEEKLWELLRLKKGHVTPMAVLNNEAKNVIVVFDKELLGEKIGVHPLENTATLFLAFEDVKRLIEAHGNSVVMCDLK